MTAVLIHGCHLYAEAWEDIVWGDPKKGRLGRVPKGILEAQKCDAGTLVFSTGASEKDGLKEGEYTYRFALERLGELVDVTGCEQARLRDWLEQVHVLELTSQNTREEVLASAYLAKARGAKRIVLVSSPTHVLRCHQAAISVFDSDPCIRFFLENLYATASDTSYAHSSVDDVVIVEPPHRGDMPKVPFHTTAKGIFPLLQKPEVALAFNDAWTALIEEYKKSL